MAEMGVSKAQANGSLAGIGGWLYLPMAQLFLSLILSINRLAAVARDPNSAFRFEPSGMRFPDAIEGIVGATEYSLILLGIPVLIVCIVLFVRQKKQTPKWMIGLYGLSAGVALIEVARQMYYEGVFLFHIEAVHLPTVLIVRVLLLMLPLVFIRYFQVSRRVKATFTK